MWIAVWLWFFWAASPQIPKGPDLFPPDDCILLQKSGQVTLRWRLPGKKFVVRFWQGEVLLSQVTTTESQCPVSVEAGGEYLWTVKPLQAMRARTEMHYFSVDDDFAYHSDGRDGSFGQGGDNGGQLTADLVRDQYGMNLYLSEKKKTLRYLWNEPGILFTVTARGGNGGQGRSGGDFTSFVDGWPGGSAGWGGNIRIITHTVPWREYLDVDLRPGQPGPGGQGGLYYDDEGDLCHGTPGAVGKVGQGGRVDTRLEP